MFVLSVEGPAYMNRGTWTTHKILGVFATRELALACPELCNPEMDLEGEDVAIITDADTLKAERITSLES